MIILALLCTVCCIVLVVLVLNGNNKSGNEGTPSGSIPSLPVVESSAPPTELTTLPIGSETGGEASAPSGSETPSDGSSIPENTTVINQEVGAMGTFTFSENLGFRTWWDLFKKHYNMNLHEEDRRDTLIAKIKEYNALPADYTPTPGDTLRIPPSEYYNE